jgi:hypothetical protein
MLGDLKRKDGKPLFHVVRHGPCQDCIDKGIGADCPHFERAPWKSKSKDSDVRAIYAQQGKSDLFDQEMRGQTISKHNYLIQGKYIKALNLRDLHIWAWPPGVIHVGIDPHGGGKTSEHAVIAISYTRGSHVVSLFFTCAGNGSAWQW